MASVSGCDAEDDIEGICITLATQGCGLYNRVGSFADVNTEDLTRDCMQEGDPCNAYSLGLEFSAVGANISGVAAGQ